MAVISISSLASFFTDEEKSIERSVYLGRGRVEKCWQLVLTGRAKPDGDANEPMNLVKWAFIKEA